MFYASLLRIAYWFVPLSTVPEGKGIGSYWLQEWWPTGEWQMWALGIVLLCVQAWQANGLVFGHRLGRNMDLYPGVFVVLSGSMLLPFLPLSTYLVANILVLLAVRSQLKVYRQQSAADHLFNTGMYIGLAALFQPTYLLLLPVATLISTQLKSGRFRDVTTVAVGGLLPLFFSGFACYWYDALPWYWETQWHGAFNWPQSIDWNLFPWVPTAAMLLLLFSVLFRQRLFFTKVKMDVQIKTGVLFWYLLGLGVTVLFHQPWHLFAWQAVVPLLGLLLGLGFGRVKQQLAEVWHLIFLFLLFFLHFSVLFVDLTK